MIVRHIASCTVYSDTTSDAARIEALEARSLQNLCNGLYTVVKISEKRDSWPVKSSAAHTLASESRIPSFDPDVAIALGAALRRRRESAGIAQDVLPILAQVDRAFYGKLERGERQPTVSVLLRIAKALGTTGAELLGEAERQLPADWRPDVERGAVSSGAVTAAMQRAAVRRAAVAKRASERRAAVAGSTQAAGRKTSAEGKVASVEKKAVKPVRKNAKTR